MMVFRLKRKKIRQLFYAAFLFILIIQTIYFSVIYLIDIQIEYNQRIKQVSDSILEQKRSHIQFIVDKNISEIMHIESLLKKYYKFTAEELINRLSYLIVNEKLNKEFMETLEFISIDHLDYQIVDQKSGTILASSLSTDQESPFQDEYPVETRSMVSDRYDVKVFLLADDFYNILLHEVHSVFYATNLADDVNIWINQIQDYEGGQKYAKRIVHPSLPEIEGSTVSTLTMDIEGNYPKLIELEGLKNHGEIFNDYYIKRPESEATDRKLNYARLLKKYNWVVAAEINLDELDYYVQVERKKLKASYKIKIFLFSIIILSSLILSLIIFHFFERRITRLIERYKTKLHEEKEKLSIAYLQMKEIALTDSLTGLYNRRAMLQKLEEEISRFKREKQSFCIILSDIDKFKKINDAFGHDTGDYILQKMAKLIKENVRLEDCVARWGGEEFLFFINAATLKQGVLVAEKLRRAIEENIYIHNGNEIKVTMTFGVSVSKKGQDLKDQINIADQNLYKGKNNHRNCVVS